MRRIRAIRTALVLILVIAIGVLGAVLLGKMFPGPGEPKRNYPVEYESLIRSNASLQGIDPAYVASIILAESAYNPNAVSSVNAQGLMQIMPDTGEWIAGKFDEDYYKGCLFDPETNIRYGSWLLGYLYRRYDGDMTCSTAAYHSGQGEVDKWLADPAFSSDGKTLNAIRGKNANAYVSKVLEYYEEYTKIYGGGLQ